MVKIGLIKWKGGNLEGTDSMNRTTLVEGIAREMVVMGDGRDFE